MSERTTRTLRVAGECIFCRGARVFEVTGQHIYVDPFGNEEPTEYLLSKCERCAEVGLFVREADVDGNFDDVTPRRVFPVQERNLTFSTPPLVRRSYVEAAKCERARAWSAAAVMIGRALEAVAKEYDPKARTFATALDKMLSQGAISQEMYEWANEVRLIRNVGAHPSPTIVSEQDVSEAIDFVQAILEVLYDLRPKFKQMQSRKAQREARAKRNSKKVK